MAQVHSDPAADKRARERRKPLVTLHLDETERQAVLMALGEYAEGDWPTDAERAAIERVRHKITRTR